MGVVPVYEPSQFDQSLIFWPGVGLDLGTGREPAWDSILATFLTESCLDLNQIKFKPETDQN